MKPFLEEGFKSNLKLVLLGSALAFCIVPLRSAAWGAENGREPDVQRMALIIGNSDYDLDGAIRAEPTDRPPPGRLKDLKNACRDAELFRQKLIEARWKEEEISFPGCNLSASIMNERINSFKEKLVNSKNTLAIFYFSGHGAQFTDGETAHSFLFGVGAHIDIAQVAQSLRTSRRNTAFLSTHTVDLSDILADLGLQTDNGVLIILDACRNNLLFGELQGLDFAPGLEPLSSSADDFVGIVTAYSTPRGQFSDDGRGDHSPYTSAWVSLLRHPQYLDTILNDLTSAVDAEYRRIYPERPSGSARIPITRGRFSGDWCVWACPTSGRVHEHAGREASLNDATLSSAVLIDSELGKGTKFFKSINGSATALLKKAILLGVPAPAAQAVLPKAATDYPIMTLYNAAAQADGTKSGSLHGTRFDVFWCEGDDDDAERRATTIAALLAEQAFKAATFIKDSASEATSLVRSIRVRKLTASANSAGGYRHVADAIVPTDGDKVELHWAEELKRIAPELTVMPDSAKTPNYISVFICKAKQNAIPSRPSVYLHVPEENQKAAGRALLRKISASNPNLDVTPVVEAVGGPQRTEIRFYSELDRDNAFRTATDLEEVLQRPVTVKYKVSGVEKPGLMEVWLGKAEPSIGIDPDGNLSIPSD